MIEKKFPKVNYIGNKNNISQWIVDNLPIKNGVIVDAFSGGSSMSYSFKKHGFTVISNDTLYSSFVLSKAIIENNNETLTKNEILQMYKKNIDNEFQINLSWLNNKLYFQHEVKELETLVQTSKSFKGYKRYLFLALLRRAMIRKIPYSRMNVPWKNIKQLRDEEYSYEKYKRKRAYHNFSFLEHILIDLNNYNESIFNNNNNNKCFQKDALTLIKNLDKVDLIYLDPPYPNTMNKYDDFYDTFDVIFDKKNTHLDLTNSKNFIINFENIVRESLKKCNYVAISINEKSLNSVNGFIKLLEKYGNLSIKEKQHNYKVTNSENKNKNFEYLIIVSNF